MKRQEHNHKNVEHETVGAVYIHTSSLNNKNKRAGDDSALKMINKKGKTMEIY